MAATRKKLEKDLKVITAKLAGLNKEKAALVARLAKQTAVLDDKIMKADAKRATIQAKIDALPVE